MIMSLGGKLACSAPDEVPLGLAGHVPVRMLVGDISQQLYLQRLAGASVLGEALHSGVTLLTWQAEGFAYAESHDGNSRRHASPRGGELAPIAPDDPGPIVKSSVAQQPITADDPKLPPDDMSVANSTLGATKASDGSPVACGESLGDTPVHAPNRRCCGTVHLDPTRVGRSVSQIGEEVVAHLVGVTGAEVAATIDIEARLLDGASEQVVRMVMENGRTPQFEPGSGFERD